MNTRTQRGNVAEFIFATEALKKGFTVSLPVTHNSHYDLVIDNGVGLRKVQVKRAYKVNNHGKEMLCVESKRIVGKKRVDYPEGGYDVLVAMNADTNDFWIIPYSAAKDFKAQIYLDTERGTRFKNDWSLL